MKTPDVSQMGAHKAALATPSPSLAGQLDALDEVRAAIEAMDAALVVLNNTPEWEPACGWDLAEDYERQRPDDCPEEIATVAYREAAYVAKNLCIAYARKAIAAELRALGAGSGDAERWRKYNRATHTMPDGERLEVHINVAVNVWKGDRWVAFYECTPDEFDAALSALTPTSKEQSNG